MSGTLVLSFVLIVLLVAAILVPAFVKNVAGVIIGVILGVLFLIGGTTLLGTVIYADPAPPSPGACLVYPHGDSVAIWMIDEQVDPTGQRQCRNSRLVLVTPTPTATVTPPPTATAVPVVNTPVVLPPAIPTIVINNNITIINQLPTPTTSGDSTLNLGGGTSLFPTADSTPIIIYVPVPGVPNTGANP